MWGSHKNLARGLLTAFLWGWPQSGLQGFSLHFGDSPGASRHSTDHQKNLLAYKDSPNTQCPTFPTHQGCLRATQRQRTSPATTPGRTDTANLAGALLQRQQPQLPQPQKRRLHVAVEAEMHPQGLDEANGVVQCPNLLLTETLQEEKVVVSYEEPTAKTTACTLAESTVQK